MEALKPPIRSPRANAFAERFVRTIRTEFLDHLLVCPRRQLEVVVAEYIRPLQRDAAAPRTSPHRANLPTGNSANGRHGHSPRRARRDHPRVPISRLTAPTPYWPAGTRCPGPLEPVERGHRRQVHATGATRCVAHRLSRSCARRSRLHETECRGFWTLQFAQVAAFVARG